MRYTLDLKNRKVIFHIDQPMDFEDILAEYGEAVDEAPIELSDKRAMEIIKAIADHYADIVDFSGDDTYLEMAVCDYLSESGSACDGEEDEDDDEEDDEQVEYEIDKPHKKVCFSNGRAFEFEDILKLLSENGYNRPISDDEMDEIITAVADHFAYLCEFEHEEDTTQNYLDYSAAWMLLNTEIGEELEKWKRDNK